VREVVGIDPIVERILLATEASRMDIAADPKPASTVIVLRDRSSGPEVFLVRRHAESAFMGGAHVFPGGRVDATDRDLPESSWCDGLDAAVAQLATVPPADAVAFHVAAVRELFEEAGVLLARDRAGFFVSLADAVEQARFRSHRVAVHERAASFRAVIEREELSLALDALVPFAHWVTPPIDVRQFDTRFFLVRVPPHQTPAHDDRETTAGVWMRPRDALKSAIADRIVLPPPTWTTLRELEPFESVDEAIAAARRRRISRRQPLVLEREGIRMLVLPGDPLHPEGTTGTPPPEVRFVRINGRWRPRAPDE
jgi:8-oxo-dGTP pyrophosphatase MutT (NUDIX family)